MGGLTSRTQEDLKLYLERDYDILHYPSILHRASKKQGMVHQITTDSTEQAHKIRSDVNLYKHLNCQSISTILEYIPLESTKICSDQEFHYIVEEDMQKYNLKEEFFARKYYKQNFTDNQIISILKTFLCGLNVYHSHFRRNFNGLINLEAITIDQKHQNHLRLTDPLLITEHKLINRDSSSLQQEDDEPRQSTYKNLILNENHNTIREAPEKVEIRKTKFNQKKVDLNEFLADIYLVGILALEIRRMKSFEKTDKPQIISQQINSMNNNQLRKIISQMTSHHPEERGKVFNFIKISSQESYHLERNFKNGNPSNKQAHQSTSVPQMQIYSNQIHMKKETSFSFGTSPSHNVPAFPVKSIENTNFYVGGEAQRIFVSQSFEKQKNASLSNMSTDRTFYQGLSSTIRPALGVSSKPIVNFNSRGSGQNISCSSVPRLNNFSSNPPESSFSQNYIPLPNHQFINNSTFSSQRTNSFLVQDDRKPVFRQTDYSPFKKQQDMSPILGKDSILEDSNYKKIFQKYSHLHYETNTNQMTKIEDKKVEQEMNRLLMESGLKKNQITQNVHPKSDSTSINKDTLRIDSPIDALEPNSVTTFAMRQKTVGTKSFESNSSVPIYRPNKQVEEILKRLGIGSLLYGNNENILKDQISNSEQQKQIDLHEKQADSELNDQSDMFVHQGAYNISLGQNNQKRIENVKISNQGDEQPQKFEDDIHDRETTPIRPAQKAKYNSTIVQVGDQDSQYSSSGVRNTQNNFDLSNHQYVVEEYQTGSRYEGYKLNGERDGHGKFFYQDGGYYEGQWKNNKMHGWGKLFYEGGKLAYQGNWSQDEFHGFGKVYNDNPLYLDCGFDFTNFDLLEDYWEYYEGMLVKDTKEGRGKIKLTNGEVFEGDFHNDRIQGFGKFFIKENSMIEGIWRDSKLIKIISS